MNSSISRCSIFVYVLTEESSINIVDMVITNYPTGWQVCVALYLLTRVVLYNCHQLSPCQPISSNQWRHTTQLPCIILSVTTNKMIVSKDIFKTNDNWLVFIYCILEVSFHFRDNCKCFASNLYENISGI